MTSTDLIALDEAARRRALEVASFIVEAPAGAGKTELLTQRYLRLLATVKEPEEVIAITFTNKAAAEMRARILNSLALVSDDVAVDTLPAHKQVTRKLAAGALARDAELGWGLRANPSRLRITTIDALSASIARQMPFLSRFGAQPAVSDEAELHYTAAALRTLALLEDEGEAGRTVAEALRYFHNDTARLQTLLVSMLEKRDQWLGHLGSVQTGAAANSAGGAMALLVASDLLRACSAVDDTLQAQLMPVARYAAGVLAAAGSDAPSLALADWDTPLVGDLDELPRWRGLAALLLTNTGSLRKRFDKNMGLPAEKEAKPHKDTLAACIATLADTPGAEEALARLQQLPEPALDADEARIVAVFAQLLKLAAAQLWTVFQQQREVDFIEVAQRSLAALGAGQGSNDADEPTLLQLRLDYRISHLLVDEFQDTSPTQIALLHQLTAGWQPDDGRTLFVVGDPMQSIYRFRKADVGLFLQARESGIGSIALAPLRLTRNNRSHPEVVDWINATFPSVFPPADNPQSGAVKFASSVATKPADDKAGVFTYPVLAASDDDTADMAEAQTIIAILRAERAAHPSGSIALLVRARSHLAALVTELQRSAPELRYQAVEIERLEERQVIQDLLALTRALHHRADRVNWLALLRAPWCGLTLPDLHALAADDHDSTVWQLMQDEARIARLSADGQSRLRHVRSVLAEALAWQGRLRPRRWVGMAWHMLGGEACLRDAAEQADAAAYFRLIDQLDARAGFTLDRLDREIAALFAEPNPDGDAPNSETAGSPAIQIMTVHKSKGLEFDCVILPGLHRPPRGNDSSLLLWEEFVDGHGEEHLVIAPVKPRRNSAANREDKKPTAYDYLRTLDAERETNEGSRVLYVAATRAIRVLHLVAAATVEEKDDGTTLKPPRKGAPLAALWPAVEPGFETALAAWREAALDHAEELEEDTESFASFVPRLTRLASPALPEVLRAPLPDEGVPENRVAFPSAADEGDEEGKDEARRSLLADIGTLAHRMLELVARDGLDQWSIERVKASQPAFRRWLQGRGHATPMLEEAATQVQEAVSKAISSEAGRWVLAKRTSEGNELALTASSEGKVQSSVIDRTFIENGERWIIDYKTARFEGTATDEDLLARAEFYRPQLERYVALLADENMQTRMGIFFLSQGRLVELSAFPASE